MDGELEGAMVKFWEEYLQPGTTDDYFAPPITYTRGFKDGVKYANGVNSLQEFYCPSCKKASYPDYGRCAYCGSKP